MVFRGLGTLPDVAPTAENHSPVAADSRSTSFQVRGHLHVSSPLWFQKKEGKGRGVEGRDKTSRKVFDFLICELSKYLVSGKRKGPAVSREFYFFFLLNPS